MTSPTRQTKRKASRRGEGRGVSATKEQIRAVWDMFEETEPDISTERLMQQTADACKCDVSDVARALSQPKGRGEA